jgi:flagellar biosynthesis/type III secretory pathway M-ring protein FliF/YscJ
MSLMPLPWGGGTSDVAPGWVHAWTLRHAAVVWLAVVVAALAWMLARAIRAGARERPAEGVPDVP